MRRLVLAVVLAALLAGGLASSDSGVTPGGLVWLSDEKQIVLLTAEGDERGRYPRQPAERTLLSVSDSGSRVTSPWRSIQRWSGERRRSRLEFRDPGGNLLRGLELEGLLGPPRALGDEAFSVSQEKGELVVTRSSASDAGTPVLRVPRRKLALLVGRLDEVDLDVSAAGLLLQAQGRGEVVYVDAGGRLVRPDPDIDCGTSRSSGVVFPGPSGSIVRVRRTVELEAGSGVSHVETIGPEGRLVSSYRLAVGGRAFPVPGLGLLMLDGAESVLVDDRGNELRRSPLSLSPGVSTAAADRLARARRPFERADASPTAGDWVELSLASGDAVWERMKVAADDPEGTLVRLLAVAPDGRPEAPDGVVAGKVLSSYLSGFVDVGARRVARGGRATELARMRALEASLAARVDELGTSAPAWFRRAAAPWVLSKRRGDARPWALSAIAESIQRGEPLSALVPVELLTRELCEHLALLDRVRLDAVDVRGPRPSGQELDLGPPGQELAFHGVERFPEAIFDCIPGSGPARFRAAVQALSEPGLRVTSSQRRSRRGEEADGVEVPDAGQRERQSFVVARLTQLVIEAGASEDPDLRAAAVLLAPYYGQALSAGGFLRDVLGRDDVVDLAATSLLADASLPAEAWKKLMSALLSAARAGCRNPSSCLAALESAGDVEDAVVEPYCVLLGEVVTAGLDESGAFADRTPELASLTTMAGATPELRLFGRLSRSVGKKADPKELLELWRSPDLSSDLRVTLLKWSTYRDDGQEALDAMAPDLLRQLREGRLADEEERVAAEVVSRSRPADLGRLAAERLVSGTLRLESAGAAEAWLTHLEPSAVSLDARLKDALQRLLASEYAGPRAAALLARSGEPSALAPLMAALKTGGLGHLSKEELAELVSPLGEPGRDALKDLCRTIPDEEGASLALSLLFETDPSSAAEIGRERLSRSLSMDCVPGRVLKLLHEKGQDPLRPLIARLEALDCDRRRLRPSRAVMSSLDGTADFLDEARRQAERMTVSCRKAFSDLLGLDRGIVHSLEPVSVEP